MADQNTGRKKESRTTASTIIGPYRFRSVRGLPWREVGVRPVLQPPLLPYHPLKIFAVWEGGMSFHGGLIGTCLALWLFCRKRGFPVATIADLAAGAAPIGLGLGRMGNFINGELFGRATDVDWCMVFPHGGPECRHPSQPYEAGLEGVLLFTVLTLLNRTATPPGTLFWTFISGYGCARFFVEFFREPDSHLGFIFEWVTMGQLLCIPMIVLGMVMIIRGYRNQPQN